MYASLHRLPTTENAKFALHSWALICTLSCTNLAACSITTLLFPAFSLGNYLDICSGLWDENKLPLNFLFFEKDLASLYSGVVSVAGCFLFF